MTTSPRPEEPLHVDVEIAVGAEPIEGVIHAPDAGPRPFTGWLALMARIDEAWLTARRTDGPP